jgi:hypothetical protein
MRQYVEIEVRRFFVQGCDNLVVFDRQGKVHKVNQLTWWAHNPFESEVWIVHRGFECFPSCIVGVWICDSPDSFNVVDKPAVER